MYSSSSSSEDIESEMTMPMQLKKRNILCLKMSFKFFQQCGSIIATKTKQLKGSMITIKSSSTCLRGHSNTCTWKSQPMVNGAAAGNVLIPAAILFSGNSYQHIHDFAKFLNVLLMSYFPSLTVHGKKVKLVLFNKYDRLTMLIYAVMGDAIALNIREKYGTYISMDENSKKVIEFSVVQVTEVTSSNAIKYEGCNRTLNALLEGDVPL